MRVWGATVDSGSLQLPHGWFFGDSPGVGEGGICTLFLLPISSADLSTAESPQYDRACDTKFEHLSYLEIFQFASFNPPLL